MGPKKGSNVEMTNPVPSNWEALPMIRSHLNPVVVADPCSTPVAPKSTATSVAPPSSLFPPPNVGTTVQDFSLPIDIVLEFPTQQSQVSTQSQVPPPSQPTSSQPSSAQPTSSTSNQPAKQPSQSLLLPKKYHCTQCRYQTDRKNDWENHQKLHYE